MTNAQKTAKNIVDEAQQNAKTAFDQVGKSVEEINAFAKDNLDALNKAGDVSAKAAEKISKELMEVSKANFEATVKAAQDIAASKTPNEMMEKQAAFAKTAFENYSKQVSAFTDLVSKSTTEAFAPINARVQAAGELVKRAQA